MIGPGIVIVGGGLAGQRCAEALRSRGYEGRIRIVCDEPEPPYDRPPLSKGLLAGKVDDDAIAFRGSSWYAENDVELVLGTRAAALDVPARAVELEGGTRLGYEKLLIATGSRPRALPSLAGFANAHSLRTLADARRLREELRPGTRLVIVGAGFIGLEVAATARELGVDVTVLEALDLPLAAIFGEPIGRWLVELHRDAGVDVRLSARLEVARGNGRVSELELAGGERIECDVVLVGIGVVPAGEWLVGSGLDPEGVRTDYGGRTSAPNVFAAGDIARTFEPRLRVHSRTEHWDSAARQGMAAAQAMLGDYPGLPALPSFWSDQYGLRIQYVGHAAEADRVRIEGNPDSRDFAAIYSKYGRTVAGLAVGRPRAVVALRKEIERTYGLNGNGAYERNGNGKEPAR